MFAVSHLEQLGGAIEPLDKSYRVGLDVALLRHVALPLHDGLFTPLAAPLPRPPVVPGL